MIIHSSITSAFKWLLDRDIISQRPTQNLSFKICCCSFTVRLQFPDILNKQTACQGKGCTFLYRETHKPRIERPHNISCDNNRPKCLEQPSGNLTWSHLAGCAKLLLNFSSSYFVLRNTVSLKQLLHEFEVMCFALTVMITGLSWGRRREKKQL